MWGYESNGKAPKQGPWAMVISIYKRREPKARADRLADQAPSQAGALIKKDIDVRQQVPTLATRECVQHSHARKIGMMHACKSTCG